VKDVRAVLVDEDAVFIDIVVRVPADVRPLVDDEHGLPGGREPLGADAAGKAGADD